MPSPLPALRSRSGKRRGLIPRTEARRVIAGVLVAAAVFALTQLFHWLLFATHYQLISKPLLADALSAVVIGISAIRLLDAEHARRQALLDRLRMVSEMNHHIRNGLQLITLASHAVEDPLAKEAIIAAQNKIEWSLREVLGPPDESVMKKRLEAVEGYEQQDSQTGT
jgi:hypothetical protein